MVRPRLGQVCELGEPNNAVYDRVLGGRLKATDTTRYLVGGGGIDPSQGARVKDREQERTAA